MPQTKRRRGFKACDPFCTDKVRKALYNRPNGPHQGKLILGKTYLSGIDGKCFSRTGRIKKGYRNVPIDLQREFDIEKRNIQSLQSMLRGPSKKVLEKRRQKKLLQKQQYEKRKALRLAITQNKNTNTNTTTNTSNTNTNNSNNESQANTTEKSPELAPKSKKKLKETPKSKLQANLMEQQKLKNIQKKQVYPKPVHTMDELERLPNESFPQFLGRVRKTTSYYLNEEKHKEDEEIEKTKLHFQQKKLQKKARKLQRKVENKRKRKMEKQQKKMEDREFRRRSREFEAKEYIPFGATNDRPPENLHQLGQKIFGKKTHENVLRNENGLNISGLSFTNITREEHQQQQAENRATQLRRQLVLKNYAKIKQRRYAQLKANMNQRSKASKRKVWKWKR